ncbi:MAG: TfoX/Sxy family protein [Chitinophagales bacterium]|nr:TfoX/Sxy family protein [Hyphomicrobiales bacterium]
MAVSLEYREFIKEQLERLGVISIRPMFGGAGVYCDGVMFALIAYETLYFKADKQTISGFEAEGMEPFTYEGKAKPVKMSYWRAPERLFDDTDEMKNWAEAALSAAHRSKK